MKILFTFAVLLLSSISLYSQEKFPIKSVKSSSELVRINTLRFKKNIRIIFFKTSVDSVFSGDEITLSWQVENVPKVTLEVSSNGTDYSVLQGNAENQGFFNVTPKENLFYRIHADNLYKIVQVIIKEKPLIPIIEYFTVSKEQIKKGEKVRMSWLVKNVSRISIESGKMPENTIPYQDYLNEGFVDIYPEKSIYYLIRIGDLIKSLKIEVIE